MNVIRLRKKNICLLIIGIIITYIILINFRSSETENTVVKKRSLDINPEILCSKNILWFNKRVTIDNKREPHAIFRPIDILGPPGSGVEWLRFMIEQLTSLYTGSVETLRPEIFVGEGRTSEVVAVMHHDVDETMSTRNAGIVIYRNLKDTIRTHFADSNAPEDSSEAPLQAYYGNNWKTFALQESDRWATRYRNYIATRHPVMVVVYDEMDDRHQIQTHLLRLSNFLRVPIKHSTLQCVMKNAALFPLKPRLLKSGFQPFQLLSADDQMVLDSLENSTRTMIDQHRAVYRPNV